MTEGGQDKYFALARTINPDEVREAHLKRVVAENLEKERTPIMEPESAPAVSRPSVTRDMGR